MGSAATSRSWLECLDVTAAGRQHANWMRQTFARSLRDNADAIDCHASVDLLDRVLRDVRVRTAVVSPTGYPDTYLGWAVAFCGAVVFAYVAYESRRGGLGTCLLETVSPGSNPWRFAFWTRAANRMAAKGYPCVYDLDAHESLLSMAR